MARLLATQRQLYSNSLEGEEKLGTPFTAKNSDGDLQFLFPILVNENVYAILTVAKVDEGYIGFLTREFADVINASTSSEREVSFIYDEDGLLADTSGRLPLANESTVNLMVTLDFDDYRSPQYADMNALGIDFYDSQGNQSWCTAFSLACIIRYRTGGRETGKTLMQNAFPSLSSTALASRNYSWSGFKDECSAWGLGTPSIYSGKLSISTIISRINRGYADQFWASRYVNGSEIKHCVTVYGYDMSSNSVIVRNPWYDYGTIVDYSYSYIYTENAGRTYSIYGGVYVN